MRAKRLGAETFECHLIFACQIIDMRVGLRLERSLRENPARPMPMCRGRPCRSGWRGLRRPCCNEARRPKSKFQLRDAKRACDPVYRMTRVAPIRDHFELDFGRFPGHYFQPPGCCHQRSARCIRQASFHASRRSPIWRAKVTSSSRVNGAATRSRSGSNSTPRRSAVKSQTPRHGTSMSITA